MCRLSRNQAASTFSSPQGLYTNYFTSLFFICLYFPPPFWLPHASSPKIVPWTQSLWNRSDATGSPHPTYKIRARVQAGDCSQLNDVTVSGTRYCQCRILSTPTAVQCQGSDTAISALTSQLEESGQLSSVSPVTECITIQ